MGPDPYIRRRKSICLHNFDHASAGLYFVTICTRQRRRLFGEVVDGCMQLNDAGVYVAALWENIPMHYAGIATGAYVVMPNHIHGILSRDLVGARTIAPTAAEIQNDRENGLDRFAMNRSPSVREIVRAFKTRTEVALSSEIDGPGNQVWQDSFHAHIIGDQQQHAEMIRYIENNPSQWQRDVYHESSRSTLGRALNPVVPARHSASSVP